MFSDLDRIIYLDGDTLIFKDLYEMFNLSFNNNFILGYPYHKPSIMDFWRKYIINYINTGVLLYNIKEIRRSNLDIDLFSFTMNYNQKSFLADQDTINYIYSDKIGFLPLKFGIYLYGNIKTAEKYYLNQLRIILNYTEIQNAIEDPSLEHLCCCNPKIWVNVSKHEYNYNEICIKYQKIYYYYANKIKYYEGIYYLFTIIKIEYIYN